MKHRIYSFPRTAKGKQIHKQFTGVLGAQATRAEPSEVRRQQQQTPSHPWLSTGMRMQN